MICIENLNIIMLLICAIMNIRSKGGYKMELKDMIDKSREQLFVCIGSMKVMLDSVAPRVGTLLKCAGYRVIGDEETPVHAMNLQEFMRYINIIDKSKYQIIAIDAMYADSKPDLVIIDNRPCHPGKAIGKKLPKVGEMVIGINIKLIEKYGRKLEQSAESIREYHEHDKIFVRQTALKVFATIHNAMEETHETNRKDA